MVFDKRKEVRTFEEFTVVVVWTKELSDLTIFSRKGFEKYLQLAHNDVRYKI